MTAPLDSFSDTFETFDTAKWEFAAGDSSNIELVEHEGLKLIGDSGFWPEIQTVQSFTPDAVDIAVSGIEFNSDGNGPQIVVGNPAAPTGYYGVTISIDLVDNVPTATARLFYNDFYEVYWPYPKGPDGTWCFRVMYDPSLNRTRIFHLPDPKGHCWGRAIAVYDFTMPDTVGVSLSAPVDGSATFRSVNDGRYRWSYAIPGGGGIPAGEDVPAPPPDDGLSYTWADPWDWRARFTNIAFRWPYRAIRDYYVAMQTDSGDLKGPAIGDEPAFTPTEFYPV